MSAVADLNDIQGSTGNLHQLLDVIYEQVSDLYLWEMDTHAEGRR